MKRRIVAFTLAMMMVIGTAGCASGTEKETTGSAGNSTEAAGEETTPAAENAEGDQDSITAYVGTTIFDGSSILKIVLPTTLPIAISALCFLAAVTDVASSGRDVPRATMVRLIKRSLRPAIRAIAVAASTVTSLPSTIRTRLVTVNRQIHDTI